MKRYIAVVIALVIGCGFLWLGCGPDNWKSPYDAPDGSNISVPDDYSYDSGGGALIINFAVSVDDCCGTPLNDIDIKTWIFPQPDQSNWAWMYTITDPEGDTLDFYVQDPDSGLYFVNTAYFVDLDSVAYWDGDGMPHYATSSHGRADIKIIVPTGYSGEIGVLFDIGVDSGELTISVNPSGGVCFNGTDDDSDGATDAMDFGCSGLDGLSEE